MRTYVGIYVAFVAIYCHFSIGFARPEDALVEAAAVLDKDSLLTPVKTVEEVKNASDPNPSEALGSEAAEKREKRDPGGYQSQYPTQYPTKYKTYNPPPPPPPAPAYPTVPAFVTPSNKGTQAADEVFGQCAVGLSEELIKIVQKYETTTYGSNYCAGNLLVAQQTLYILWVILRNIRLVLLKQPQPYNCLHVTSGGLGVELALENIEGHTGVIIKDLRKLDNEDPLKKTAYTPAPSPPYPNKKYNKPYNRKKRDYTNSGSSDPATPMDDTSSSYEDDSYTDHPSYPQSPEQYPAATYTPAPPKYVPPPKYPQPPVYSPKPASYPPTTYPSCSVLTWEQILSKNYWKDNVVKYCKDLIDAKAKTLSAEDLEDFRIHLECDMSSLRLVFEKVLQGKFVLYKPQDPKKELGYYRSPALLDKGVQEIINNALVTLNGLLKPAYSVTSKPVEVCFLADQYSKAKYCYDGQVCAHVWKRTASGKCSDPYTIDGTCLEARCISKCAAVLPQVAPCLDSKWPQVIIEEKACPADSATYPKGTNEGCVYSPVCAKQILTFGTSYSYSLSSDAPGKFLKGYYTRVTRWLTPQYKDCVVAQAGASKPATCNSNEQCWAVTVPSPVPSYTPSSYTKQSYPQPSYNPPPKSYDNKYSSDDYQRHRRGVSSSMQMPMPPMSNPTTYQKTSYSWDSACLPIDEDCKPRRDKDFCNFIRCTGTCSKIEDVDCKKRTSGNADLKWLLTPLATPVPSNYGGSYSKSYPASYPAKFVDLTCSALPSCSTTYATYIPVPSSYSPMPPPPYTKPTYPSYPKPVYAPTTTYAPPPPEPSYDADSDYPTDDGEDVYDSTTEYPPTDDSYPPTDDQYAPDY